MAIPTEVPVTVREFATTAGLKAAIAEFERTAAAQREAARHVRALRDATRAVIRSDEEAFSAALRRNPAASEADAKPKRPQHEADLAAAARRSTALAQAVDASRKDLNRQLRNARAAMTAALVKAIDDEVSAAVTTIDALSNHLDRIDQLRAGLRSIHGGKGATIALVGPKRRSATPPTLPAMLADIRAALLGLDVSAAVASPDVGEADADAVA